MVYRMKDEFVSIKLIPLSFHIIALVTQNAYPTVR